MVGNFAPFLFTVIEWVWVRFTKIYKWLSLVYKLYSSTAPIYYICILIAFPRFLMSTASRQLCKTWPPVIRRPCPKKGCRFPRKKLQFPSISPVYELCTNVWERYRIERACGRTKIFLNDRIPSYACTTLLRLQSLQIHSRSVQALYKTELEFIYMYVHDDNVESVALVLPVFSALLWFKLSVGKEILKGKLMVVCYSCTKWYRYIWNAEH